jgi:uncharacterized membrane protein
MVAPVRDRLLAIDWMRGLVMVLMTIDHASLSYNAGRVANDSAYLLDPATGAPAHVAGVAIPALQFFVRWITHLCAPTFLFLSGTSLAMSIEKRRSSGETESSLDRHLWIRGGVILGCEALLSLLAGENVAVLQVLYAIGLSLWAMVLLRRLPSWMLAALGIAWLVLGEALTLSLVPLGSTQIPLLAKLLLAPAFEAPVTVIYPLGAWLAMMVLGWVFGRYLLELPADGQRATRASRSSAVCGFAALAVFALIRGVDAYGNMGLHRDDASIVQWLHVSKYPPSLAYSALELGLMGLGLAGFFGFEARMRGPGSRGSPLRVFGQAALLYYMVHIIGLAASALALTGGLGQRGLPETFAASAVALLVLYPACIGWRRFKSSRPGGWPQYF